MKALLLLLALAASAQAGTYYDNQQTSSSDTLRVAGVIKLADPAAPFTVTCTINGISGVVTCPSFVGALTGNASTASAAASTPAKCAAGNYPLGVDASFNAASCTPVAATALVWTKYTKAYTDFSTAALSNSLTLFSLTAKSIIHAIKIKHSASFSGGAIATYTVQVGVSGDASLASAFNVKQATGTKVIQLSHDLYEGDETGSTTIQVTAVATGANLNAASAGSVDIWVLTSQAN